MGGKPASSQRIARQEFETQRQDTEEKQEQSQLHIENMAASQPAVKLLLDTRETANDATSSKGQISIATESWLDRATAKAHASMRKKNKDDFGLQ